MQHFEAPWCDEEDGLGVLVCARCYNLVAHGLTSKERQISLLDDDRISVRVSEGVTPVAISLVDVPKRKKIGLARRVSFLNDIFRGVFKASFAAGHRFTTEGTSSTDLQ